MRKKYTDMTPADKAVFLEATKESFERDYGIPWSSIEPKILADIEVSFDDRIHTAFHGYLRQLLSEHGTSYEADNGLSALFTKLHEYYETEIKPPDVANRLKSILRSAGGMINAVNELRNNNTIAHPNGQLIQKREAQLVIRKW